ncbi:Uncharacterised protein [Mycoplasmopsis maculosa]|uniref:Uncharacterized protein n=1 Tax=Mycoplasmopsis maculosa TaxID=114885 RepID=A0A449B424_9BACT|nr:hypothetical protein [Mycoplasmopsis maculosa]VEU75353.1 Uncharacterised protein [Mycoplasmopsis maculosa]
MNKKNKKEKIKIVSYGPLVILFFIFIFCIIPHFIFMIFSVKEFGNQKIENLYLIIFIPLVIFIFSLSIQILFIYFKIINLRSLVFSIPINVFFIIVMLFSLIDMYFYIKYIIAISITIVSAYPLNVLISKIEDKLSLKKQKNN